MDNWALQRSPSFELFDFAAWTFSFIEVKETGDFKYVRIFTRNEASLAIMNTVSLTDHYCYCKKETI